MPRSRVTRGLRPWLFTAAAPRLRSEGQSFRLELHRLDPADQAAAVKTRFDAIPRADLGRVADERSALRQRNAVPAGEDIERADRVQSRGDAVGLLAAALDPPPAGALQPLRQFVQPAFAVADAVERQPQYPAVRQIREPPPSQFQLADQAAGEPLLPVAQAGEEFLPVRADVRRGVRRRQGPMIRDQVRDRDVGFMADGADDRDRRLEDRPGDEFLVERPQVFEASAAAADDHDVGRELAAEPQAVQRIDRLGDLVAGPVALDADRDDDDVGGRPATADHFEHVANRGPGGAGDDGDPPREPRKRLLVLLVEPAAGEQLLAELPQG